MSAATDTVGFLGTGTMGRPMAANAAAAGLSVRAWNRSREKAAPLAERGVAIAATPAEAAEGAGIVVTMLSDADAVLETMERGGALDAIAPGTVWAQMSTIGIAGVERCIALAREHRVELVDAPVLGTKQPAEAGELTVLAAGPEAAVERCAKLFDAVGRETVRLGEAGEATRLKLVLNSWIASLVEALAETIALAEGLGIDPGRFLETISGGPLDVPYAQVKGKAMLDARVPSLVQAVARPEGCATRPRGGRAGRSRAAVGRGGRAVFRARGSGWPRRRGPRRGLLGIGS